MTKYWWFPHYNIFDKKIYGLKTKNSLAYYHELRHKYQHEKDLFTMLFVIQFYILIPIVF